MREVNASGRKWVTITDESGRPQLVLDADSYLRAVMFDVNTLDGYAHCHRPIVVTDPSGPLGHVIGALRKGLRASDDDAIDKDIVLLWTDEKKHVITGADLLGRLLRGIESA